MAPVVIAPHPNAQKLKKLPLEAKRALSLWREKKNVVALTAKASIIKQKVVLNGAGKPKALIATYTFNSPLGKDIVWMYYPRSKDVAAFSDAANYVKPHGPASLIPGSVGSINVVCKHKRWTVIWAQAHFHTKNEGGVKRALATEYGGWRLRLFVEILSQAKKEHAQVILKSVDARPGIIADFKKAALATELPIKSLEQSNGEPYQDIAGVD